jgi:hypothetical protein
MWQPNPKDITCQYHRNGIGGEGFTAITFTQIDEGATEYDGNLIAIVPEDDGTLHDVRCFVVNSTKPNLCYRGDNYNATMLEIIKAHDIRWNQMIGKPDFFGITKFKDMKEVQDTIDGKTIQKETSKRFENIIQ